MHQIMHYSALVGASWLSSNVLFVIAWSWLHSRKRHWMSGDSERPSIFTVCSDDAYLGTRNSHYLSGSVTGLGPVGMPVNRAS
jgi:hypothetical protein